MKRLRIIIAVMLAKIIYFLCKISGSRASAAPGKYASKICPYIIDVLSKKVKKQIIIVCGTNGKTTTNNLINTTLVRAGYKTVCNSTGANMINGIITAFCVKASVFASLDVDFACLEVDEATLPILFSHIEPSVIVVTNLFRDQLDRYGEVETTSKLLKKAFDMALGAKLVLNADDPVTAVFGEGRDAVYYGVDGKVDILGCNEIRDGALCAKCGHTLTYEYYMYGQIGRYRCENCLNENPKASYLAKNICINEGILHFDVTSEGYIVHAQSSVTGIYNVYNMLMAFAATNMLGIDKKFIMGVLCSQKPQPGRMSRFNIKDKTIYLLLSKNPIGFNQSVTTVINDKREKSVLLALNDRPQDGEDVSWIWDVDFESLLKGDAKRYIISGERRYDMYIRLKYANYDENKMSVYDTTDLALKAILEGDEKISYLLVNYSAMYPMYKALKAMEEGKNE